MQKKKEILLVAALALMTVACGGGRRDAAYYEQKIDSIRKAEQLKELQLTVETPVNPIEAWFDSLNIHTLPIRSAGGDLGKIGSLTTVPMALNGQFGYPVSAKLKALSLPWAWRHPMVLLAEVNDSLNPVIYLFSLDRNHVPLDQLCIYERKEDRRLNDYGHTYMDYFITSQYEITLMMFYQSNDTEKRPELLNSRRFIINKEGMFEETIIEL